MADSAGTHRNHNVTLLRSILRKMTAQSTPFFGVAILCLVAFAALAAAQYPNQERDRDQDRDRDRDRAFDRGPVRVSHERMTVDYGGGNGGHPTRDALCDENFVAVGFHVQMGEFFNNAWLDCVHVGRDGDVGNEVSGTEKTGSPGGSPIQDAFCPRGMVLRGLRGRVGGSIDEAVGICSPLREIAGRRERMPTEMTQPVVRPRAGGHPAEAICPIGSVVTGFHSNGGEYMDHLWVLCSELRRGD